MGEEYKTTLETKDNIKTITTDSIWNNIIITNLINFTEGLYIFNPFISRRMDNTDCASISKN